MEVKDQGDVDDARLGPTSDFEEDEEDDSYYAEDGDDDAYREDEPGWRLASRGVRLALNNRVEEAERLLRARAEEDLLGGGCVQAQAGLCFLTFMVSMQHEGMLHPSVQTISNYISYRRLG